MSSKSRILYYEISDGYYVERLGGKYFRYTTTQRRAATGGYKGPDIVGRAANRIWCYDPLTDSVEYVKNRATGTMTPVDPKEFVMIQLRAEEY